MTRLPLLVGLGALAGLAAGALVLHRGPAASLAGTAADSAAPPCHRPPEPAALRREALSVQLPPLELVDSQGQPFSLSALAQESRPIALNFIFTTCTTICPVMSASFQQLRAELGPQAERVKMISVTIDPQHDRPEVLAAYAARYAAPADWSFLSGDAGEIRQLQRAFGADHGSKFNHRPATFLREASGGGWWRLEGQGSAAALAAELRQLLVGPRAL